MEVRVEIEIFAKRVNDHHHAGNTIGKLKNNVLVVDQAVAGEDALKIAATGKFVPHLREPLLPITTLNKSAQTVKIPE
jgi:hypothetical protein